VPEDRRWAASRSPSTRAAAGIATTGRAPAGKSRMTAAPRPIEDGPPAGGVRASRPVAGPRNRRRDWMAGLVTQRGRPDMSRVARVVVAMLVAVSGGVVARAGEQPSQAPASVQPLPRIAGAAARNVVFILSDDHRYDAMGFMGHPIVKTPNMDRIAQQGAHLRNAFVTTALCSPSRASILTGVYAHQHKVVDNNSPVPAGTVFFPQYLQKAGYQTALVGKWHMGNDDGGPQPGFDRWVSFRGQGTYLPSANGLNVDGTQVPQKGYISDELTDYALEWLTGRDRSRPFFLYLSHKGVHQDFVPADRHKGTLASPRLAPPRSQAYTPEEEARRPRWVRDQRNSWHGVDYPYNTKLDVAEYFQLYAETLRGVDDSIGRVLDYLRAEGLLESTLVIYMGDNGFAFGEHGLIDKRTAYEESMRVPMVMQCPELFSGGRTVEQVVANLDIAPTVLAAAGLQPPAYMQGASMLPLAQGRDVPWRQELLYEYYWERNFPQTPTVFALRGAQYKFIRYHGVWDIDELFDLKTDPLEMNNLSDKPEYTAIAREMSDRLFDILERTSGRAIPLYPDRGPVMRVRTPVPGAEQAAPFPPALIQKPGARPY
jgi:N-acetylglucosamine-6-sulfatase